MFFKDVQKSYETRSKLFMSAGNLIDNIAVPATFLESGGLADAKEILRDYHRQAVIEANKAREVENEVVQQLTSLRSDLQQKTKEIKSLSGDFKNSVDKEVESTRKAVRNLQESLGLVDVEPAAVSGKHDPFILRLQVDRQIEKQIDEENYLHRVCQPPYPFTRRPRSSILTFPGVPQPGKLWTRARVDRGRRDSKSLQCLCQHPQARGGRSIRHGREAARGPDLDGQGPRMEQLRQRQQPAGRSAGADAHRRADPVSGQGPPGGGRSAVGHVGAQEQVSQELHSRMVRFLSPFFPAWKKKKLTKSTGTSCPRHTSTNSAPPTALPIKPL